MAKNPVDEYLQSVSVVQRETLQIVRQRLLAILPSGVECISYGMPAIKVDEIAVAGFAAFKNHCSYFPHSGQVIPLLEKQLAKYETSDGTLRFSNEAPLPLSVLRLLVKTRLKLESEKLRAGGKVRVFYDSGIIQCTGTRKAGEMHGAWKWYRKDGSLMRAGSFKLGKQCGVWSTFDRAGKCVKETQF